MTVLILAALFSWNLMAQTQTPPSEAEMTCRSEFAGSLANSICAKFQSLPKCRSVNGKLIPYYDKPGHGEGQKRILVFGQIHGDEYDAGKLATRWIERLDKIDPHNSWRIVPRLNPDGNKLKTRANANGVDLNRNFPTMIWDEKALADWRIKYKKNPRRYPGPEAGSEPETKCAVEILKDFKPDIVVSIHTPYGLLDFDGPKIRFPKFTPLRWHLLGTFPGSLGRYMWIDHKTPVLTVELGPRSLAKNPGEFNRLQDLISYLVPEKPHTREAAAN